MIQKRRVALNNVQLDEIDDRIIISGIDEAAGKDNITAVSVGAGDGQRITNIRRDTLDITVKFTMAITNKNMKARSELLERVNEWAYKGGWLKLYNRADRRIMVVLAQAPGGGDIFTWTNEYSIVFRAYSMPFWEDVKETAVTTAAKASGTTVLNVPGTIPTGIEFTVTNKSGQTIDNVTLTVGESGKDGYGFMVFKGLKLKANKSLVVDYLHTQRLYVSRCRIDSTGVAAARTPESVSEFRFDPGPCLITWKADRAVQVKAACKGRYL